MIGKTADLREPGALKPGERELDLPNLNDPKANWAQNSSRLREAMSEGKPIRDASAEPLGKRQTGQKHRVLEGRAKPVRKSRLVIPRRLLVSAI